MPTEELMKISIILLWLIIILKIHVEQIEKKREKKFNSLAGKETGLNINDPFLISEDISVENRRILNEQVEKIVLFTSPTCSACSEIYPVLNKIKNDLNEIEIILFSIAQDEILVQDIVEKYDIKIPVIRINLDELMKYKVKYYPFGYYLSEANNIISKGIVTNEEEIRLLKED
ncbi:TlpA family protein disulfide reductase [Paenibacillus alvei]|uniref:TlpA family protein disulfide reductase n=1 Tax=Paenibacillus alvei TaxID=44250 RepID=UPI002281B4E6|nr:thioredoxin family protein [Paenibacillus alvei]MCY7487448.1 thioredoxin family protein [Paenibacillus alvei]